MRRLAPLFAFALLACSSSSNGNTPAADTGVDAGDPLPVWMSDERVFTNGEAQINEFDCRNAICQHNENTDLVRYQGAIYLVHRTAESQILGPNSALLIFKSTDEAKTFTQVGRIPSPIAPLEGDDKMVPGTAAGQGRDMRDPHFYVGADGHLRIKAITRLPVSSAFDSNVDSLCVTLDGGDGTQWASTYTPITPIGFSLWRIKAASDGTLYSIAYADGDASVTLFSSKDGLSWTKGALVYGVTDDHPLETEIQFMPSGKMLAIVRMDGTASEELGTEGRLRTKMCWADAPYSTFDCSQEIDGQRLDGPLSFTVGSRLFVLARSHLQPTAKKRTTLFELTGNMEGGPLAIQSLGDLPSAGDTSYAGQVKLADGRIFVSWYSSDLVDDVDWLVGMLSATDIRVGIIDPTKL